MAVNMAKLKVFVGKFVGDLGAAVHSGRVVIGVRLFVVAACICDRLVGNPTIRIGENYRGIRHHSSTRVGNRTDDISINGLAF